MIRGDLKGFSGLIVGIDAVNVRRGGGVTHLVEILRALRPESLGIDRVVVWAGRRTLDAIDDKVWLVKFSAPPLDGNLIQRVSWQRRCLAPAAREAKCDVLFVPGGSYSGDFHPVVTMSQNLLPFDHFELRRYGASFFALKQMVLRWTQSRSFRRSDGVIFLTNYARDVVLRAVGEVHGEVCVIPHGLNGRFVKPAKTQRSIDTYDVSNPYRFLYVSAVDLYKHQWHVVQGVASLRQLGYSVVLDLVGPSYLPAMRRLREAIRRYDPKNEWVFYHGEIPYEKLESMYADADLGVWASSCETFGLILLEAMASRLPLACSSRQPTPEIVGSAAVYFDPEQPADIAFSLRRLIDSPGLRSKLSESGYQRSQFYSWQRCAETTFRFLASIARNS